MSSAILGINRMKNSVNVVVGVFQARFVIDANPAFLACRLSV
jgi:hypothetical protein